MAEVTPELHSQITEYLNTRERGEKTLLSFFYKEVFGRKINDCAPCYEEASMHLKKIVSKKAEMRKFKWKGGKNVVNIRVGGKLTTIGEHNCTDTHAELISTIDKYSHMVEQVNFDEQKLLKKEEDFIRVGESEPELPAITSTSEEAKKEGEPVKKKRGRPKLK